MGSRFSGHGRGQVAYRLQTQGGVYALLKSISTDPSSATGPLTRKRPPE
jgi:hypothetical protein